VRQLVRIKFVRRKMSRGLDKELKANPAQHRNTIFKQVKKPLSECIVRE